jgi:hypothetical protein
MQLDEKTPSPEDVLICVHTTKRTQANILLLHATNQITDRTFIIALITKVQAKYRPTHALPAWERGPLTTFGNDLLTLITTNDTRMLFFYFKSTCTHTQY